MPIKLSEIRHEIEASFKHAGMDHPQAEAKWFLEAVLDKGPGFLIFNPDYILTDKESSRLSDWLTRRLKGEPLSRLRGVREFWSLPSLLNESTLDPRADSETLVEAVLEWVGPRQGNPWRILDLGTGSGCLLIALLHEFPQASGVGVDISQNALSIAQENAELNYVEDRAVFLQGSWTEALEGSFDIIISNPPYIPTTEKSTLKKEVTDFDPPLALYGGVDGLDAYRILAPQIKPLLAKNGFVALELGRGQRPAVETIFSAYGFSTRKVYHDLAGIERVIGFESDFSNSDLRK